MIIPPTAKDIALAIAAPITPSPAPTIVMRAENISTSRVGYIIKKFRMTFVRFTAMPTSIGVFVSPDARKSVPNIILAHLKSIGVYKMKKYLDAREQIFSSTYIHTGT